MSVWSFLGGILGGAGSLGSAIANPFLQADANAQNARIARENMQLQRDINQQNIDFQRETNQQNEALMRESWARDDSAYQRKAADMQAAGLSKTLAAGGSAMSSSPVTLQAPHAGQVQNLSRPERIQLQAESLLSMSQLFARMDHEARIDNLAERQAQATIDKTKAETVATLLQNQLDNETYDERKLAHQLKNDMVSAQISGLNIDNRFKDETFESRKSALFYDEAIKEVKSELLAKSLYWYNKDKQWSRFKDVASLIKFW